MVENLENTDWFDPIACIETNACNALPSIDPDIIPINASNDGNLPCEISGELARDNVNKRPRGRPRKVQRGNLDCLLARPSPSCNLSKVQKTWNTAKMLGVSASDEDVVLSELRKSKRLLPMENNPQ